MPGSFVNESLMLSAMEVMTRVINSNDSTIPYFGACSLVVNVFKICFSLHEKYMVNCSVK